MSHSGNLARVLRQGGRDGKREKLGGGLPEDAEVHAVTVHPNDHDTLYVGSSKGIFRSANRGGNFEKLNVPGDPDTWSILVHPRDPKRIYAGASPIHVYRSDDGGDNWKRLADPGLPDRVIMAFSWRVVRLGVGAKFPYG